MTLLAVDGLRLRFGGIIALDGVGFTVAEGEIRGLIGPNGAGKTSLFNCLSRIYRPDEGSITFAGRDLLALGPHRIAAAGIGRTFQNLALFPNMTVRQNVMVGAHATAHCGFLRGAFRPRAVRLEEAEMAARADELLEFVRLSHLADTAVGALPFGFQKRVETARALACRPRLLLLDEPAAGLNHDELGEFEALVRQIRDRLGVAVLLIEHHLKLVMALCDRIVALDFGARIAEGTPDEIRRDPAVIKAYLGAAA